VIISGSDTDGNPGISQQLRLSKKAMCP